MESQNLEYKEAKLYAVRRLSRQNMLSVALAKALKQRAISEATIERLISEFIELGYLNDQEWVAGYVRGQVRRKQGPRSIGLKLMNKGVCREEIEEVIGPLKSDEEQKASILALLSTRYKKRNLTDPSEKQKVVASLARRGFSISAILSVLRHDEY